MKFRTWCEWTVLITAPRKESGRIIILGVHGTAPTTSELLDNGIGKVVLVKRGDDSISICIVFGAKFIITSNGHYYYYQHGGI